MGRIFTQIFYVFMLVCATGVAVQAQTITVSGTVKDKQTKEPLVGVTVMVKGQNGGTATNAGGNFSFSTSAKMPFTLMVSYVGYGTVEQPITGSSTGLDIALETAAILGADVVVSASRTPERILESPVSIERLSAASIREIATPSFYDALNNMKGVESSMQSLTFKSINTRGFNSNGNTRFNQYIDGMDNQAPGLNFSVGNIVGITELDIDNVELLPGASSALYGAGGINGTLLMTSKDPFKYQGASFQYKTGVNHVNDDQSGTKPFNQLDVRLAKSWNNKFGVKAAFSFLQARDWYANNYTNFDRVSRSVKSGDRNSDPNYDGINSYGDELSQNMRNVALSVQNQTIAGIIAAGGPNIKSALDATFGAAIPNAAQQAGFLSGLPATLRPAVQNYLPFYVGLKANLIPDQNISRNGYNEANLVDYDTESLKASGALYYNLSSTVQAIAQANWGTGTSVYTGSDRYSLRNFNIGQYKLELKGEDFMLRAYTTQERSGDSYISSILGSYINEVSKPSTTWFPQYIGNYIGARAAGQNDVAAHAFARNVANQGRFEPGGTQFETTKNNIMNTTISATSINAADPSKSVYGAKFDDKTNLYHYEGMYNFTNAFNKVVEFQVGASYRIYDLNSAGTIFDDLNRSIDIEEYGAFAQVGKKLFNDKVKLTFAGRYDKSQNFEGRFTPRITGVFTVAKNNNIRISYQTGYRNPTTQNQYIDLSVGGGTQRLIGGLPEILSKYNLYNNKPFTDVSYRAFLASAAASGVPDAALLQTYNFTAQGVRPESVQSYELGYKGLILPNLLIDAYGYYNKYKDFITAVDVYQNTGTLAAPNFVKFGVPVNAAGEVTSYGAALGLDYVAGQYNISGNVSYNEIGDLPANYINDFNTPKIRYNLGFGNKEIVKNFGFNLAYRWQDKFYWNSSFASGEVPAYSSLDAQLSLRIPSVQSVIKLGGSNVLNKYYTTSFGNPDAGAIYYLALTFNP